MKTLLVLMIACLFTFSANAADCLTEWESAFNQRGAYSVTDNLHNKVYVVFYEDGMSSCVAGKAKVENQKVVSFYLQYEDGTYSAFDRKFYNAQQQQPTITNGISEWIYSVDGDRLKIIFVDFLKTK